MSTFEKIFILDVGITNAREEEILELIYRGLLQNSEKYYIVTPNPELLVKANKNPYYKNVLNNAKLALPDGVGVTLGAYLLGKPLKERITGVDFVKSLSKLVSKQPITVGFLGGEPNVAVKTAECLREKYPGLRVIFTGQEWDKDNFKSMENGKWKMENSIDILFVAFGSPKQEIWISENLKTIPARVIIGVGGAFDLISGKIPRAPKFLRKVGLEWLFRLIIQPWRLKRQLSLLTFVFLVLKEKLKGSSNK